MRIRARVRRGMRRRRVGIRVLRSVVMRRWWGFLIVWGFRGREIRARARVQDIVVVLAV